MLGKKAIATFVGATTLSMLLTVNSSEACKRLSDPQSIFRQAFGNGNKDGNTSVMYQQMDPLQVLETIDTKVPWLSQCIANIDPEALMLNLMLNPKAKQCIAALSDENMLKMDNGTQNGMTNEMFTQKVCPMYRNIVVPCVHDVAIAGVAQMMDNVGSCCEEMKSKIMSNFGTNVQDMVKNLLHHVGNIMCSEQTFSNGQKETCAFSLYKALKAPMKMTDMLQIPQDQVCDALAGKEFKITTGGISKLFDGVQPLGACSKPLMMLVQQIVNYPIMKSSESNTQMMKIFQKDVPCVNGKDMYEFASQSTMEAWNMSSYNFTAMEYYVNVSDAMQEMETKMEQFCFKFPLEISNCKFDGQLQLAYETVQKKEETSIRKNSAKSHDFSMNNAVLLVSLLMGYVWMGH